LFEVTVIHVEYWDAAAPLPSHALIVNVVGDADLCDEALTRADPLIARSAAPTVNPPALVRATSRAENARRLGAISGVVAPDIVTLARADFLRAEHLRFPLLLRTAGFHTGQNFVLVETRETLAAALESLPGDELMAIEYLDARGPDGLARKYRVMFIEGKMFPLHLAISHLWKVHYFTSGMADHAAHREEERRFLENMPAALGERAMAALDEIRSDVGLDYFGVDFALAADGSVLLFEANAAMVVIAPPPEPIWDYRRGPVAAILEAAKRMALSRVLAGGGGK
jgi:glutathione synthase/RimK-type ligase-like ATP-grasp enzyme